MSVRDRLLEQYHSIGCKMRLTKFTHLTDFGKACLLAAVLGEVSNSVQANDMGFVVSHIEFALANGVDTATACPDGMSQSYQNIGEGYIDMPKIQQRPSESNREFYDRFRKLTESNGVRNLCQNPELGGPNPTFRTVSGDGTPVYGINIDGDNSKDSGACFHSDFTGVNGEAGIDNQFYRVFGCVNGFQPSGQANDFATEMLTGSWGILIKITDVEDAYNDESVGVGIYANGDPIKLSPSRVPLRYASYSIHHAPRFHAETTGEIVDGVLTTAPVDVRFPWVVNAMHVDRYLRDARLQATIGEDGRLDGYLAGYSPVEIVYDVNVGFRNAIDTEGEPSPQRRIVGSAFGKANVMGYTCEGVYHALYANADGHPDPETGKCNSISTQFRIQALPAFVIDSEL